jgi:hypothetical protein
LVLTVAGIAIGGPAAAMAGTGADGSTYVISSFDGTSVVGLNDQGRTLMASLDGTTFRAAQLDRYIPNDPYRPSDPYRVACRAAASDYNDALVSTSDNLLDIALGELASLGCKARVVQSPSDPYLPPNPIRVISFQPVP